MTDSTDQVGAAGSSESATQAPTVQPPAGAPGQATAADPTAAPVAATAAEAAQAPQLTPKPEIDLSQVPLDDILQRADVQRSIQSTKDKAVAVVETRLRMQENTRVNEEKRLAAKAELDRLLEEEDHAELGRKYATELTERKASETAATELSGQVKSLLATNPEFAALGNDRISVLMQGVTERGGNVVDFMVDLHRESQALAVSTAEETLRSSLKPPPSAPEPTTAPAEPTTAEVNEEAEAAAAATAAQLQVREAATAAGQTVEPKVTVQAPAAPATPPTTYEEASIAYGEGRLSWNQFKPIKEAHIAEQG